MEFSEQKPIYKQIADYVLEKILTNAWPPRTRLPSVRELAQRTAVNPNTVMRAYSDLQDQKIIFNQRGIGFFTAEDARQKAAGLKKNEFITRQLPPVFKTMQLIKLDINEFSTLYKKYINGEKL